MKLLLVFLLVGTMMVLSKGFPEPEPVPEAKPTEGSEPEPESPDEESPDEDEHNVVKRAAGCRCGWRRFGSRCLIVNGEMTWAQAQKRCLAMGGNLLSIHNVHQNNWALSLLGSKRTWCAGSDAQENGQWLNIDGTPFNYAKWCRGQPDNYRGAEQCAEINFKGNRCWNDAPCTRRFHSICARRVSS